ncbi:hypothetical protein FIBSPDRAFT_1048814 [Athelia psychrophila]|uniref:Transmembrane protein 135 N-terminal domain-containing protein n=1 Tax=Athelia psychrophila TaxID=1759441 RepID=A0A166D6N8_9AGAM|nr:hypothetical protein FIBSPDRAFT_1048814 [Fibularhizoctonia sp. CBS 109695]
MASSESPQDADESSPSYNRFGSKRAMASFDNLVALANHQERLREARKMVWRDKGEPAVKLLDVWDCAGHAGRGALRAATLGYVIRASLSLVLALMRIRRVKKQYRFTIIRKAIFGEDPLRFASMLGSFTAIYKFLINALPILFPTSSRPRPSRFVLPNGDSTPTPHPLENGASALDDENPFSDMDTTEPLAARRGRLSVSAAAHQVWVRKKTRRWQSALAGSLAGGVAILCEKKNNRLGVAQQMFVRGLQGSYNAFSTKHGFSIPYGDTVVFALCCGQIMYGFLLSPEILPPAYQSWINAAGNVPVPAVSLNHSLVRKGLFNPADVDKLLQTPTLTPHNRTALLAYRALSAAPGRPVAPCFAVHPTVDSCRAVVPIRFAEVFRWMLPVYGALHFVPLVLFRWRLFLKDPKSMLLRAGAGTARSSSFLGAFVVIFQGLFCFKHHIHDLLTAQNKNPNAAVRVPQRLVDALISKESFWPLGFLCGLSILVEESRRRGELAMYVLPKGLGAMWSSARGRGWVFGTGKWGEPVLTAIGMGMVMSTYQNDPQHLSSLFRRVMYQFIGPN